MGKPQVIATVEALRAQVQAWRVDGARIAMVPTMGALHEGHLSLCRLARAHAERLVVSIFVNPKQFAPNEDLAAYPRPFEADLEKLASVGTQAVFAPSVEEMYPANFSTLVRVGGVSEGLCAVARPTHFDGVSTVVTKLLLQCLPDYAVFGEKDYQQLQIIKRLVRDLNIPVSIIPGPTVREADGLALSSRNVYLTHNERGIAPELQRTLQSIAEAIRSGAIVSDATKSGVARLRQAGFEPVEYLELRDAETLEPMHVLDRPARLLVAARLGKARLIDNVAVSVL